ncbi:hypothetical protein J4450_01810 [Candidatus Micrarchaeota archaeon]|nr:hypothetical protein [Candidatus Micrarchaeota archaeon]
MQRTRKTDKPGGAQATKSLPRFQVFVPLQEEVAIEIVDIEDPKERKRRLTDFCGTVDTLVSIIHFSQYEDNKLNAVEVLAKTVDKLTNEDALTFIALYSQDLSARLTAVEKLKDNYDALVAVSEHSEYSETRTLAKQMINRAHNPGLKTQN